MSAPLTAEVSLLRWGFAKRDGGSFVSGDRPAECRCAGPAMHAGAVNGRGGAPGRFSYHPTNAGTGREVHTTTRAGDAWRDLR